jgi:hypothetical protein
MSSHLGAHDPTAWQVLEPKAVVDVILVLSAGLFGLTVPFVLFDGSLFS